MRQRLIFIRLKVRERHKKCLLMMRRTLEVDLWPRFIDELNKTSGK